jgi:hypothetical protein
MPTLSITGGCHCGAVAFAAEVEPDTAGICHCADCQVLTGTAFRVTVGALPGTFRITSGVPRVYTKTAASGRPREQAFCEHCGTPLYATSPGPEPRTYGVRVGAIHQRAQIRPADQIWTRSAAPWLAELASLPAYDTEA